MTALKDACHQLDALLSAGDFNIDHADTRRVLDEIRAQAAADTIVMAQINTTPGDLAGNAQKIMRYAACAEAIGASAVVFPELSIMGYPIRDVITRHPFLVAENLDWLKAIARHSKRTRLVVGFVEPRKSDSGPIQGKPFYNSLAVLGDGKILSLVRKTLLPTYNEFEDDRTFEAAPASGAHPPETLCNARWGFDTKAEPGKLYALAAQKVGLSICEDTWNDAGFFDHGSLYPRDPMAELAAHKPDLFINISASPTRSRKEQLKHHMLAHIAQKYGVPYLYVNQTGSVDEVAFDGGSRLYDANGKLLARAKCFDEQFMVVSLTNPDLNWVEDLPTGLEKTLGAQKFFDAYDDTDLGRTYEALLQGIRDYFGKTGFTRAVLGVSGGLDSSVVATLLADALRPENVIAVSMPSEITPDDNREDAEALCKALGVTLVETPIAENISALSAAVHQLHPALEKQFGKRAENSNASDNAQAITRATILRQIGNDFNALPIATSDKSELYLGYATVNGDMSGALAPLGDVPKTKVRALFRWMNTQKHENRLPLRIVEKPSGADLKIDPNTGKPLTAEADLMPYEFADEIIWRIEALRQDYHTMLSEVFQYEKTHDVSADQKRAWLDKFYQRMARAVFKWFIIPPILMIEGNGSISKTDYHHPITASRIRWQGHSADEKERLLKEALEQGSSSKKN